ncbi:MAG: tetratricopeptide repeat protein [Acidobacteriota bacterium]|jgi:Flp pilus assembly protein TadD|nr:tetratricopeptide repeat protein [Acidobacteriota bacterium]
MKLSRLETLFPFIVLVLFLPWASAQQGDQGGSSGSGTGSTGSTGNTGNTVPKTPPPAPSIPQTGTQLPESQRIPEGIFISGLVVQDDGLPPPFGTEIEIDCGNTVTREATVSSDGSYGFQIGSANRIGRVMPDASDSFMPDPFDTSATINGNGSTMSAMTSPIRTPLSIRLMRCELRAQYPGYRSTSVRISTGNVTGYVKVDPILLYRIEKIQGTSVSATSLLAPKDARKSMERAAKALAKNKLDEAERLLKSSLQIYPQNAEAQFLLGNVHLLQMRSEEARIALKKAMEVDVMFVRPYIPLARLELAAQDWETAAALSDRALELDPVSYPEAYLVNALAYYYLEDMVAAERSARKGLRLDLTNQFPMLHLVLANVLARKQDEPGSLDAMRQYVKAAPKAADAPIVRARIQEKEKLLKAVNE